MRTKIILLLVAWSVASSAVYAELVAFYDFNDASNPEMAFDVSGNENHGEVIDAEYTDDAAGYTGEAGDRAMDFGFVNNGAYVDLVTAADGAFDSLTDNDMVTLSMWVFGSDEQPVDQWTFYAGPNRQLGSHIPWSNENVYFDVAGTADSACCEDRINTIIDPETYAEEWNHYAFVKNEDITAIYQNGEFLLDGVDMRPLNEITEFFIGAGPADDRRSYSGLIDDFGVWDTAFSEDEIIDLFENGPGLGPVVNGDFDGDGMLGLSDINMLTMESGAGTHASEFDLNGDNLVDGSDVAIWAKDLKNTWIGDSNLDGEFNSSDFVTVFGAGLFETGRPADWSTGDWNGDGVFSSGDFVTAFTDGGYERGPRAATAAVPEPGSGWLLLSGLLLLWRRRR